MELQTLYTEIGSKETVYKLVDAFYPKVYSNPDLIPLFEGTNMEEIKEKQKKFLTQFLGGPPLYSIEYGPPAMQRRHLPFEITPTRARAWLSCMHEAMDDIGLEGKARDEFFMRLQHVASIMINSAEPKAEDANDEIS